MTRRRWITDQWTDTTASLTGTQALHLARVLRATSGMHFDVVADGTVWLAEVSSVSESRVEFNLLEQRDADAPLALSIFLSVFKFDRFEWAIEKLTELGVSSIHPIIARRTEKHLAQAAEKRVERWRRIALEAAKQSRRSSIPSIEAPTHLSAAIAARPDGCHKIILSEMEKQHTLLSRLSLCSRDEELFIAIGPEGGWTSEEQSVFAEQQWESASLGATILRAETAAISAAAICAAWLNHQ